MRIVKRLPRLHHTREIFLQHKIVPVTKIYDYRLSRTLKQEHLNKTSFIQALSGLRRREQSYNTRNKDMWEIKTFRTTYGLQTLEHRLPQLLNDLLRQDITLQYATFQTLLAYFLS